MHMHDMCGAWLSRSDLPEPVNADLPPSRTSNPIRLVKGILIPTMRLEAEEEIARAVATAYRVDIGGEVLFVEFPLRTWYK